MGCLDVVNDKNLRKFNDEHTKGVWFVWFYADWCGHCRQMAEPWADFANRNNTGVNLAKVRDDFVPRISSKPNIQGWPTIMLYKNGVPVDTYQGERTPEAFNHYVSNNSNNMSVNNSQDIDREVVNANNVIRLAKPKAQKKKKSVKKPASNSNSKPKKQTRKRKRGSNSNSNPQKPKRRRSKRRSKKSQN